ncbi:MAG: sel1 repeat family protein [Proteobacteria bacterium]|nr:sel1 repeat family protein [Pseudomonadota bacterium]
MSTLHRIFYGAGCAVLLLASGFAIAQKSSGLSVDLPESRTMATQRRVDELFDAGNYKRAFFLYRNELAPLGDKYAQYMVGYMYLSGKGIDEDYVAASAWYRLAAERGTREFIAVRDQLTRNLTDEQIFRSDALYSELRREYCDLVILLSFIKRDVSELQIKTGTHVNSRSSPILIVETRIGRVRTGFDYYSGIRDKLEDRLRMLKEVGDFQDLEIDPDHVNVHELERRVEARLSFGE